MNIAIVVYLGVILLTISTYLGLVASPNSKRERYCIIGCVIGLLMMVIPIAFGMISLA